jgi:DNA-nicking Smr family endonuclease
MVEDNLQPWLGNENDGYRRAGIQVSLLKLMRKPEWDIQRTLDLHGLTQKQAEAQTRSFITRNQLQGKLRLCIIHGKGRNSETPVLRNWLHPWLFEQSEVLAFTHPQAALGGSGATVVLLKRLEDGSAKMR